MPTYIVLAKFTEQGVRGVRDIGKLIETNNRINAGVGVKVTRYFTMGEYDMVALVGAPSDEVAMTGLLGVGSAGNLRTTTMKAYPEKDFLEIVKKLPPPAA